MKRYKVNIIILNYEGRELLEKYLNSIVAAAKNSAHDCTVTVLDNVSTDESVVYVTRHHPAVKIIRAEANKVLCSYNDAAKSLDDDILILLNNDIRTDINFIDPLIAVFDRHPDAFFVSTYRDLSNASFRCGVLTANITFNGHERIKDQFGHTLSAGAGAFDRRKFLALGGYDEMYLPGRYEDVDLCFRGWKQGWRGYYEPKSILFHEGQTSFNRYYSKKEIERLVFRNSLLFMIKNITDPLLTARFLFFLPLRLINFLVRFKFHMIAGFFDACGRLPVALKHRQEARRKFFLSDRNVIQAINHFAANNK